jgi:hypothetical protein
VFTNDNPRSEDPEHHRGDAVRRRAVPPGSAELLVEPDRAAAIALRSTGRRRRLDRDRRQRHEQGQETAGVIRPFDDRAVLRAAIEAGARHDLPRSEIAAVVSGRLADGAEADRLVTGPVEVDSRSRCRAGCSSRCAESG